MLHQAFFFTDQGLPKLNLIWGVTHIIGQFHAHSTQSIAVSNLLFYRVTCAHFGGMGKFRESSVLG